MTPLGKAPGARFEISIDGVPRSHRDRREIAVEAAGLLMAKYPHSAVAVKYLQRGTASLCSHGSGASPRAGTCSSAPSRDLSREPLEVRKATLASLLRARLPGLFNQHLTHPGDIVFRHACAMGLEGIVSKRLGSRYVSGRSKDWLKFKNPEAPAVKREAEEG
jgi:hypothetical protein